MEPTVVLAASPAPLELLAGSAAVGLPAEALGVGGALAAAPAVLGINLLGDDEDDEGGDDEDDDIFDDGDDLGDLDDLDDGALDGFEDEGDELGGGENVDELENRIDELENEVASLSSSVNTVENENEAISETVDEIEENVRDLLEIYEMVTRGVNPFVDDAAGAMGGAGGGGDFGLFDDGGGGGDVDESIADADAEEFFDDDFEEPDDDLADPDDAAVMDDGLGGMDDGMADADDGGGALAGMDDGAADSGDGSDGGKSFEELKEEYESGEPGWDVDEPLEENDPDGGSPDADTGTGNATDDETEESREPEESPSDGEFVVEGAVTEPEKDSTEAPDDETPASKEDGGDDETPTAEEDGPDDETPASEGEGPESEFEFVGERDDPAGSDADDRLHLREFPEGYVADLTALEWLEYLIDVGGKSGARDALGYYVDVGWIAPDVEDELHAFLDGIRVAGGGEGRSDPGGLAQFDPEHHRRSLAYVARLAGDGDQAAALGRIGGSAGGAPLDAPVPAASPVADGGDPDRRGGDDDGV